MTDEESLEEGKTCCKNRTWLEIALIVLVSIMALFILGSFGIDFRKGLGEDGKQESSQAVCTTSECVKTASEVLARIDPTIDPCEDFYRFSCGTFAKNEDVRDSETEISTFSIMNDLVENQLRCMLEEDIKEDEAQPFVLLKSLYKSCMDVENVNAHSIDTLKMWFENSGGWPVVAGNLWDEESFNIKNVLDIICEHSITFDSIFFEMRVEKDPKDDEKKMLFMYQPVRRSYFIADLLSKGFHGPGVQEYYEYMIEVAAYLGAPKITAAKEMREVIDFEIELAKIISETVINEDSVPKTTRMTIHELLKTYGFVDWLTHLNKIIYPAKKRRTNDEVIVTNPSYFKQLDHLLEDTPKKTLANYMHWTIVHYMSPYLHEDLRNMANVLNNKIYNTTLNHQSRWTFCINIGPVLARKALYSRNYLNDSLDAVKKIVQDIKSQYFTLIEETEWMDSAGKKIALEKANNTDVLIDYPDEFEDDEVLEEYYKDLDIDPENYLDSILKISIFNKQQSYSELDESLDDTDWRKTTSSFTWNYYTAVHDTREVPVTLPATAFQGIFFNNNRPKYMNYGSIGFVIANKLTHSMNRPEMKDEDKLVWQPETRTAFKEKTDCILDQNKHSNYQEGSSEFISTVVSIAAVEEAYLAYKDWTEANGEEEALPGLESCNTPGQLFWISLGNIFCSVTNSDASKWKSSVLYGDNRDFINVLVMNSEHFSEDFKCPEDSKMNPRKKCSIW